MLLDISFVENALSLPIFEPLTVTCIQQLTGIMVACLRLALSVKGTHSNMSTSTGQYNLKFKIIYN